MGNDNMYKRASRERLRYNTSRGLVPVERLWEMPLESENVDDGFSLDALAMELQRQLKDSDVQSFVHKKKAVDTTLELQFEIVKDIIETRLRESKDKENAIVKMEYHNSLVAELDRRKKGEIRDMTGEELKAAIEGG